MNNPQKPAPLTAEQVAQQRKARWMMFAIVAVFVLPFIVLPLLSSPERVGKTNKGTLIQPHVPLADLALTSADGAPFNVAALETRWSLFYVIPAHCDGDCAAARDHALYAMRQVRLSLDREVDRVQNLVILSQPPDPVLDDLLNKEFGDMKRLQASAPQLQASLLDRVSQSAQPAGHIFLMSPDGYVFMAYPTFVDEHESVLRARDIRSDLKKTLKGDRRS